MDQKFQNTLDNTQDLLKAGDFFAAFQSLDECHTKGNYEKTRYKTLEEIIICSAAKSLTYRVTALGAALLNDCSLQNFNDTLVKFHNQLSTFVIQKILFSCQDKEKKLVQAGRWLRIANQCLKDGNADSALAIAMAFSHDSIERAMGFSLPTNKEFTLKKEKFPLAKLGGIYFDTLKKLHELFSEVWRYQGTKYRVILKWSKNNGSYVWLPQATIKPTGLFSHVINFISDKDVSDLLCISNVKLGKAKNMSTKNKESIFIFRSKNENDHCKIEAIIDGKVFPLNDEALMNQILPDVSKHGVIEQGNEKKFRAWLIDAFIESEMKAMKAMKASIEETPSIYLPKSTHSPFLDQIDQEQKIYDTSPCLLIGIKDTDNFIQLEIDQQTHQLTSTVRKLDKEFDKNQLLNSHTVQITFDDKGDVVSVSVSLVHKKEILIQSTRGRVISDTFSRDKNLDKINRDLPEGEDFYQLIQSLFSTPNLLIGGKLNQANVTAFFSTETIKKLIGYNVWFQETALVHSCKLEGDKNLTYISTSPLSSPRGSNKYSSPRAFKTKSQESRTGLTISQTTGELSPPSPRCQLTDSENTNRSKPNSQKLKKQVTPPNLSSWIVSPLRTPVPLLNLYPISRQEETSPQTPYSTHKAGWRKSARKTEKNSEHEHLNISNHKSPSHHQKKPTIEVPYDTENFDNQVIPGDGDCSYTELGITRAEISPEVVSQNNSDVSDMGSNSYASPISQNNAAITAYFGRTTIHIPPLTEAQEENEMNVAIQNSIVEISSEELEDRHTEEFDIETAMKRSY